MADNKRRKRGERLFLLETDSSVQDICKGSVGTVTSAGTAIADRITRWRARVCDQSWFFLGMYDLT